MTNSTDDNTKRITSIFHLNIQCITNKIDQLLLFLEDNPYDIICFSEHWLNEVTLKLTHILNYNLISFFCRKDTVHGGTSIYIRDSVVASPINLEPFCREIDAEFCGILLEKTDVVVFCLYRSCLGNFQAFLSAFEEALNYVVTLSNKIVILGDFNVNFKMSYPNNTLADLINLMSTYELEVTISDFTRITSNTATCIDNIVTNINSDCFQTGIVDPCMSDHLGLFININYNNHIVQNEIRLRNLSVKNLQKFNQSLLESSWDIFSDQNATVDDCADYLLSVFSDLIDKHFPFKNISLAKPRLPVTNWFTNDLKQQRQTLSCLKMIADSTRYPADYKNYNNCKYSYRKEIQKAKSAAYIKYILNSSNKSKASWNLINQEGNRKCEKVVNDCKLDSESFNNYFCTVSTSILESLPTAQEDHSLFLNKMTRPTTFFFLYPVVENDVQSAINSLKNSSCFDIYDINTKILKSASHIICPFLSVIINKCFCSGYFPNSFKVSKVLPIFKKGDKNVLENYRPISIVPLFGKVIEVILKNRLVSFLDKFSVLSSSQFGFIKGRSTIQAVLEVVADAVDGLDRGELRSALLCDLSKAFDCISHGILLDKLVYLGIDGVPNSLIKSYLSNRRQLVSINGAQSGQRTVNSGVPQGSVLGPLLFIIYVNDFAVNMLPSRAILYADDSTLLISATNSQQLHDNTTAALDMAQRWFTSNSLKLNCDKTQLINFSFSNVNNNISSVKMLGITMDSGLKWQGHIDDLCNKLSKQIYLLRQLKKSFSVNILKTVYFANFHSILCYGAIIWGGSSHADKAFRVQKRAIRVLEGVGPMVSCRPLFIKYNIMALPCIFIYQTLLEIHRLSGSLPLLSHNHNYNTRAANTLLLNRFRLTSSTRNSLDLRLYNKLGNNVKLLTQVAFKNRIKSFLLKNCFYSLSEYLEAPSFI